jgi:chemotaxis family two-component system response regulator Rcp1
MDALSIGITALPARIEDRHPMPTPFSTAESILLIEDNPGDVQLLRQALDDIHCTVRVHAVPTVADAIAWLREHGSSPSAHQADLIVLDLNLPAVHGMMGLELIKATEDWSRIPVLIFSSSARRSEQAECKAQGAIDFWVKPVDYAGYLICANNLAEVIKSRGVVEHPSQRTFLAMPT